MIPPPTTPHTPTLRFPVLRYGRSLELYLSVMRRLLRQYNGYEGVAVVAADPTATTATTAAGGALATACLTSGDFSPSIALATVATLPPTHSLTDPSGPSATTRSFLALPGHLLALAGRSPSSSAAAPHILTTQPLTPESALCLADAGAASAAAAEGWVMVCAFRTPRDALSFAMAAQAALLRAEWPARLLEHRKCAALYAVPVREGFGAGWVVTGGWVRWQGGWVGAGKGL